MHPLDDHRGRSATLHWVRLLWLALTLTACGGGVESGGTGSATFASGPITGFGSVIVDGVRFDDVLASISDDDGTARNRDELRLGMIAEIRGSAITTDVTGSSVSTAASIVFSSDILGRIDSIDLAGSRMVVLGQTVDVTSTTVFDDANVSGGLPSLLAGDVVEVFALFDAATGHYSATRIERKGEVAVYRLRGIVSALDTVAKAFNIGSERISYAGFNGTVPAALANGNFLRVRLQTSKVNGQWLLAALKDGVHQPRDSEAVRLEGVVSEFTSATRFKVNGVPVDSTSAPATVGLALGVRLEVEGTAVGGVLVASKVTITTNADVAARGFELRGQISSVDTASLGFVLRGVPVRYSLALTDFRDGTAANLAAGVNVEVRGVLSPDGTRLLAARITFK